MIKLDEFLGQVKDAALGKTLIKISIGHVREKASYLKKVFAKSVMIKDKLMLSFVYRYADKDVTKNFTVEESITTIKKLLQDFFYNAELYTAAQTDYFTQDEKGKERIVTKLSDIKKDVVIASHDKQKKRIIRSNAFYLKELDITSADGLVKASMQHKYKQINRYVEIIDGILKEVKVENGFSVVDMGSGKGYLTFALYDFLQQKNIGAQVKGIELREDLVLKCNSIAASAKYIGLQFEKGSIQETTLPTVDMLIALHACDTATDDAIAKGIKANATYIICAPCCHKQIRKQMAPTNALKLITKHGILLERQAEMVTDTIRALILEAHGYKTKVFDFIEEEDTPKNVLIVGTKAISSDIIFKENMDKVKALKEMFGIKEHYLETLFA
jgi:2-polyprenyl-3-methyl-5-hydroxy-6-metoxy-1,4-benzoquinol methylase